MSDQCYQPVVDNSSSTSATSSAAAEDLEPDLQSTYGNSFVVDQLPESDEVRAGLGGWLDMDSAVCQEEPNQSIDPDQGGVCTDPSLGPTLDPSKDPAPTTAEVKQDAPKGHDVSNMDPAALAELEAKDPKMAQTIKNAQLAYADMIKAGAKVTVTTSDGNGGKPVVVIVPAGFDPSQPVRVHTHYHGYNSTVADPMGHGAGTTARISEVQSKDPQTVFVLPECDNVPEKNDTSPKNAFGKNYATRWTNVKSVTQTTDDALASAGVSSKVGPRVISAHSGGGAALASAIKADPSGEGLRCDQLELEDCLYGSEGSIAKWADTAAGKDCKRVLYFHGSNDAGRDAPFAKKFGDRYKGPIRMSDQPKEVNPVVTGADGKPLIVNGVPRHRWKKGDPHNRTAGEFMDYRG